MPLALLPPPSLISLPRSRTKGKIKRGEEERPPLPDSMAGALEDAGPALRSEGPSSRGASSERGGVGALADQE